MQDKLTNFNPNQEKAMAIGNSILGSTLMLNNPNIFKLLLESIVLINDDINNTLNTQYTMSIQEDTVRCTPLNLITNDE